MAPAESRARSGRAPGALAAAARRVVAVAATLAACAWASEGWAHGAAPHGTTRPAVAPEQKPWGIAGDPKRVTRTIDVSMDDRMRFVPALLRVREGETVRLRVRNAGRLLHELVIGTREELESHAALMLKVPDLEHDEPHMVHVDPGRRGQIVWHFNRLGEFEFACLIPGHFQAGMVGRLVVEPAPARR
jgi:uncharacterized cupredoxin-like copper-binding protein